jgi:hypothetical protein
VISLRRSALLVAVVLLVLGTFLAGTVQTKAGNRGVLLIFLPGFNTDSTMPGRAPLSGGRKSQGV